MIASKYNNPPFVSTILNNLTPEKLMEKFLDMGLDELSVAPSSVLPIRKLIREAE